MAKKNVKNLVLALAVAGALAGCAAGGGKSGVQLRDLSNSTYFITETMFSDMDFPSLQRNLYQHRSACGSAPRFVMEERETSLATLIETAEIPESYDHVVVVELIQYPESWRANKRVAARAYSYYYNDDVQKRLDRMLDAVRRPGTCEPAAQ